MNLSRLASIVSEFEGNMRRMWRANDMKKELHDFVGSFEEWNVVCDENIVETFVKDGIFNVDEFRKSEFFKDMVNKVYKKVSQDKEYEFFDNDILYYINEQQKSEIFRRIDDLTVKRKYVLNGGSRTMEWYLRNGLATSEEDLNSIFREAIFNAETPIFELARLAEHEPKLSLDLADEEMTEFVLRVVEEELINGNRQIEFDMRKKAFGMISSSSKIKYILSQMNQFEMPFYKMGYEQRTDLKYRIRTNCFIYGR